MTYLPRYVTTIVAAIFCLVCVAGCSTLPTSGPVIKSDVQDSKGQLLSQEALGPAKGSSPERLVKDFLKACSAGTYDDYAVAREYLTAKAAKTWKPEAAIAIATDNEDISVIDKEDGKVKVSAKLKARIDSQGKREDDTSEYNHQVILKKNKEGEFRIDVLPMGIIIPHRLFYNAYNLRNVYFLSTDKAVLVPDPRWVPRTRMVSHLVDYLIAGPSQSLSSSVKTAFPQGKQYIQSVNVDGATAKINLEHSASSLSNSQRSELLWQMQETLKAADGVSRIELSLDTEPIVQQAPHQTDYDMTTVIGMSDRAVVSQDRSGSHVLWQRDDLPVNLSHPAMSPLKQTMQAAVNNGNSIVLLANDGGQYALPRPIFAAPNVMAPSVDRCNWVWTGNSGVIEVGEQRKSTAYGTIVAVHEDGRQVEIAQGASVHHDAQVMTTPSGIVGVRVSLDGTRLAVISVDDEGRSTLHVMVVERSDTCEPEGISHEMDLPLTVKNAEQLTWTSPTSIAVVGEYKRVDVPGNTQTVLPQSEDGAQPGRPHAIESVQLGGEHSIVNALSGMESVYGGGTTDSLYVVNSDGVHFKLYGTQWRKVSEGLKQASFPG
ncbi:MAG: LpqB family beta-propeller domain-containing protein [Actinomycetaceae bacterium]|nr:LpqB family beta-propeller domain-containing protein [Actinomycetaceae bacterium]